MVERTPRIIPLRMLESPRIDRRDFLRGFGVAAAALGAGLVGCQVDDNDGFSYEDQIIPGTLPLPEQYPQVPPPPPEAVPAVDTLRFFTEEEAAILDALVGTILPSDDVSPGAREAGVVNFIDYVLSEYEHGFAHAVYRQAPFARPYEGDTPPGPDTDEVVWVPAAELHRYGYQTEDTPQEIYRQGLQQVEELAQQQFGAGFAELQESQLEELVGMLADDADEESGFFPPSLQDFYLTLRSDIVEGMFSDPAYGGNVDFIGWRLVGFPGAQRAYTERDMQTPGYLEFREIQGLAELHATNPGYEVGPNAIVPLQGPEFEPERRPREGIGVPMNSRFERSLPQGKRIGRNVWLCQF